MSSVSDTSARPGFWPYLRVWISVGAQSFGGGTSTLALMRRAVVDEQRWLTDEQFTRDWALCQICPGINLLGLAILIGGKVLGRAGVVLSLLGLLLPSVSMTILLTAAFTMAYDLRVLQSAIRGAIPATVGLGLLTCLLLARSALSAARVRSVLDTAVTVGLIVACGGVFAWLRPSPILLLLAAGSVGALYRTLQSRRARPEPAP